MIAKIARVVALAGLVLFSFGVAHADSADETLKTLPASVQKTIKAEIETRSLVRIDPKTRDGKTHYKVIMRSADGMQKRLFLDPEGKVLRLKIDVDRGALPAPVRTTVDANSAGLKFVRSTKVSHDSAVEYEVEFEKNGRSKELLLDPAGKLERVEEVVDIGTVPAPVKAAVEKEVGKGKLIKVEASTLAGKPTTYEAQIDRSGTKAEVTYASDGKELERE
jgi:hypothetical protein